MLIAGLVAAGACAGCGTVSTPAKLGPARTVVVATAGAPSALFAPIYEGIANGDFARGALSVSVAVSGGEQAALSVLSAGHASFAVTSEPALLAARASGAHLVGIASLYPGPLESIISLESHPISAPRQLANKTVATNGTPLAAAELATFLAEDSSDSRVHTLDAGTDVTAPLLAHRALASVGGLWSLDAIELNLAHDPTSVIRLPAAGVPTFSELVLVVRVGEARHDGSLLRAFLQSLTRSEAAVEANPAGAATLLASLNPHLSRRLELASLNAERSTIAPPRGDPYGWQNPSDWVRFASWMSAHGLLSEPAAPGYAITDEFLPGQGE
jgi:putative hydroxymethylpyrimidine transport system substrate-binding protein